MSGSDESIAHIPSGLDEFDPHIGFHHLVERRSSPATSVWTTTWVANVACAVGTIVLGGTVLLAVRYGDPIVDDPLGQIVATSLIRLLWIGAFIGLIAGMLHRGKLVVDFERRELRSYRGASMRPRHVLPIDSIRKLEYRQVDTGDLGDGDTPASSAKYDVLVAELEDDRVAMIAVNTPRSLRGVIARAAGRSRHQNIP